MQAVINRLRKDEDYYGSYGQRWLSASTLKQYLKSLTPENNNQTQFIHPLAFGNAFHQSLLEPSKFQDRVWLPNNGDNALEGLCDRDREHIYLLANAVLDNPIAKSILEDGNSRFEVPYIGQWDGINLKCKVDIETDDCLWDLKTTGNLEAYDYTSVNLWGYHISAYQYYLLTGKVMNFIVVEKNTSKVRIIYTDKKFYEDGKRDWIWALNQYKKSLGMQWIYIGKGTEEDADKLKEGYEYIKCDNNKLYAFVKQH